MTTSNLSAPKRREYVGGALAIIAVMRGLATIAVMRGLVPRIHVFAAKPAHAPN